MPNNGGQANNYVTFRPLWLLLTKIWSCSWMGLAMWSR